MAEENGKMPAARPSQASVTNTLAALADAGLRPVALHVSPDGAFSVELVCSDGSSEFVARSDLRNGEEVLSWDDVK